MPPDSRTKIRPQQSCLKCRERKVKCDRSVPCHACIIRGLEAECTYLTTPEDRAHISQAEIIERLRREVAQLREQLNQSPRGSSPGNRFAAGHARAYSGYAPSVGHGAAGYTARGHAEQSERSWPGSSPSSSATALTSSATVTSPDSTGSDGGWGMGQLQASSAYTASMGPHVAETDGSAIAADPTDLVGDDSTVSQCHAPGMGFATGEFPGSISMQAIPPQSIQTFEGIAGLSHQSLMHRDNSPTHAMDAAAQYIPDQENYASVLGQRYASTDEDEIPLASRHQWQPSAAGTFSQPQAYLEPSYFPSGSGPVPNSNPSSQVPVYQSAPFGLGTLVNAPSHDSSPETPIHNTSDSWKGEDKQELLETLLETIGRCDEDEWHRSSRLCG